MTPKVQVTKGNKDKLNLLKIFKFCASKDNIQLFKNTVLGSSRLLLDEAEYLFPSHWLPETHWSRWETQTWCLLWKACGTEVGADTLGEEQWELPTRVPHEERCLGPCPPVPERALLPQTTENWVNLFGVHYRCDLSALTLVIVKRGKKKDLPGLAGITVSSPEAQKAGRSLKLFNLSKEDNVHQYVWESP